MIRNRRFVLAALVAMLGSQGALDEARGLQVQLPDSVASVQGRVLEHETGRPLGGVAVTLMLDAGGAAIQVSGDDGTFSFPSVPPGLYRLSAVLLGYAELRDSLQVQAHSDVNLTLPLSVSPLRLEPVVVVVDRRPVGPLQGFERRRLALRGTFLTREAIQDSNSQAFTDLLRPLPGVRLVPTATYGNTVYFRGGCTPDLWLDGTQVGSTSDIDSFLRPEDLEAVEIYRGPELPGEFGTNLCGAIVAWTLRGPASGADVEGRTLKKQLIFAGSFVMAIVAFRRFR